MDVYCEWNSDLVMTPNGSIQTAVNWDETRERILRALITNSAQTLPDGSTTPPDYIFVPSFGIGLAALVDQNLTDTYTADIKRRVNAAVFGDPNIDPGTMPTITLSKPTPNTIQIYIQVTLINGQPGQVAITLGSITT